MISYLIGDARQKTLRKASNQKIILKIQFSLLTKHLKRCIIKSQKKKEEIEMKLWYAVMMDKEDQD